MSSLSSRGATGAGKSKPLNVNSIYSGRNLAAGGRPTGKYGLQSVGKTTGVVRRMPPPATLPSLKAENNGQDPTINVVPQGGTGWNKTDGSANTETVLASALPVTNSSSSGSLTHSGGGADLRPTWAKPANEHNTGVGVQSGAPSTREFPSLAAASAQGKDGAVLNKWTTGELPHQQSTRDSGTLSFEDSFDSSDRSLPARFYDNAAIGQQPSALVRRKPNTGRFQGSNDARLSPPPNYQTKRWTDDDYNADSRRVHRDSEKSGASEGSRGGAANVHSGSGFFDGVNASETVKVTEAPARDTLYSSELDKDRDATIERSRQRRAGGLKSSENENEPYTYNKSNYSQNGGERPYKSAQQKSYSASHGGYQGKRMDSGIAQQPQPEITKILKRPPQQLDLEDVSDEEEVQMTKLDKPSLRIIKRVADARDSTSSEPTQPQETADKGEKPQQVRQDKHQKLTEAKIENASETTDSVKAKSVEETQPAPPPAENIWAKRKEERESQERNLASKMPKVMEQAINQHFPSVAEAATIKVAKDATRKPTDLEFAKVALRARKLPTSNDVRQLTSHDAEYYQDRIRQQRDRTEHGNYSRNERAGFGGRRSNYSQGEEDDRSQYSYEEHGRHENYSNGNKEMDAERSHEERELDYEIERNRQGRDGRDKGGAYEAEMQEGGGYKDYGNNKNTYNRSSARGRSTRGDGMAYGTKSSGRGATRMTAEKSGRQTDRGERHSYQLQKRHAEQEEYAESGQTSEEQKYHQSETVQAYKSEEEQKNISPEQQFERETDNVSEKTQDTAMSGERKEYGGRQLYAQGQGRGRYPHYGYTSRGIRGKARGGMQGSGRYNDYYYKHKGAEQLQELRGPRRNRQPVDDESEEAGQPTNGGMQREGGGGRGGRHAQTQGAYEQRRGRGMQRRMAGQDRRRVDEERKDKTEGQRKDVDRLKSPVTSSEGHEEWETASESSGRGKRDEAANERPLQKSSSRSSVPPSSANQRNSASQSQYQSQNKMDSRIRSKNVQPASRTSHSPSAVNSSSNAQRQTGNRQRYNLHSNESEKARHYKAQANTNSHNDKKKSEKDELAGLDLNCVDGSVVIVDSQMQEIGGSDVDDFKEVVSKKVKRQQEKEKAARLEAEERRKLREKEKRERITASKLRAQEKRTQKKSYASATEKSRGESLPAENVHSKTAASTATPVIVSSELSELNEETIVDDLGRMKDMISVKTVWTRSSHVEEMEKDTDKDFNESPTVIPSPIARPTPRCKSATEGVLHAEDNFKERLVELPVPLSNSQPLQHSDKYDFSFDPHLHEVQQQREVVEKVHAPSTHHVSVPVSAPVSETGSIDDQRLKEKLNKVKDLWPGEHDKENPIVSANSSLPSNVAKVKPQPQGDAHVRDDGRKSASGNAIETEVGMGARTEAGSGGGVSCARTAVSSAGQAREYSTNITAHIAHSNVGVANSNTAPRSPSLAPFSNALGGLPVFQPYPQLALSDMSPAGGYAMPQFGSSAPAPPFPPNAASPPTALNAYPGPPIGRQQRPPPTLQQNFMDHNSPVFVPNRGNQSSMWTPNTASPLDGMIGQFGSSLQQPPQHSPVMQFSSARQPQNRQFGNNSSSVGTGKGSGNFLFSSSGSNDVALPPPSLAVGSQRAAPPQSLHHMQGPPPVSYNPLGGAPSGSSFSHMPPSQPMNQPPPSYNQPPPNMRFTQPPPNDMQWGGPTAPPAKQQSMMSYSNFPGGPLQQLGSSFSSHGPSGGRFPQSDVWSNSPSTFTSNGGGNTFANGGQSAGVAAFHGGRGNAIGYVPKMHHSHGGGTQSPGPMKRPPSNGSSGPHSHPPSQQSG